MAGAVVEAREVIQYTVDDPIIDPLACSVEVTVELEGQKHGSSSSPHSCSLPWGISSRAPKFVCTWASGTWSWSAS